MAFAQAPRNADGPATNTYRTKQGSATQAAQSD